MIRFERLHHFRLWIWKLFRFQKINTCILKSHNMVLKYIYNYMLEYARHRQKSMNFRLLLQQGGQRSHTLITQFYRGSNICPRHFKKHEDICYLHLPILRTCSLAHAALTVETLFLTFLSHWSLPVALLWVII